jgi:hypothetical protein
MESFLGDIAITTEIESALKWLRDRDIGIAHPSAVRDYLLRYPDMANLLYFFCSTAQKGFGVRTQLSLEVYIDPEIEDTHLTLYARQTPYEDDFWRKVERVSETIRPFLEKSSGWFIVTTDFAPPK